MRERLTPKTQEEEEKDKKAPGLMLGNLEEMVMVGLA